MSNILTNRENTSTYPQQDQPPTRHVNVKTAPFTLQWKLQNVDTSVASKVMIQSDTDPLKSLVIKSAHKINSSCKIVLFEKNLVVYFNT